MFDKIKKDPLKFTYTIILAVLVAVFASLFCFCILQSDDYYYATFFKGGVGEFVRLTAEHFKNINGRALVHFFAQIALALPKMLFVVMNSAIVFFIGFFSFKVSQIEQSSRNLTVYLIVFYISLLFPGSSVFKEVIMWTSGFYNYVFPALIAFFALYLCKIQHPLKYILCFLAGATTEQWGLAFVVMIAVFTFTSLPFTRRNKLTAYVPVILSVSGYITIFLSPATQSRLFNHGSRELAASLIDIPSLSGVFFLNNSCIVPICIFILCTLLSAYFLKGSFSYLYSGFLPLFLIVLLPLHQSYMCVFIIFICYALLWGCICLKEKKFASAAFLFSGLTAILVILPTNTFEPRIAFPGILLLLLSVVPVMFEIKVPQKVEVLSLIALLLASSVLFAPTYTKLYGNHLVEKANLSAIKNARESKVLYYCIDYDKSVAMRQMFNDGWFYSCFLSLYGIEDCKVYMDSKAAKPLFLDGERLKSKALVVNEEMYVPMRTFLEEAGGSITFENGTEFSFNGKTITCLDGIFVYTAKEGYEKYLIADENKILDFYTMCIRLDVVRDAFNIKLNVDNS